MKIGRNYIIVVFVRQERFMCKRPTVVSVLTAPRTAISKIGQLDLVIG